MTPDEIKQALDAHARWFKGEGGGVRANLRGANLRGADLRESNLCGAYLRGADLRDADLRGANLSGANLRESNLCGAYLRGADLRDADLRGANLCGALGLHFLTQTDHGYTVIAQLAGEEWRIRAGCRDFTIVEAREHWGSDEYEYPSSGRRILACLDWLEAELAREEKA